LYTAEPLKRLLHRHVQVVFNDQPCGKRRCQHCQPVAGTIKISKYFTHRFIFATLQLRDFALKLSPQLLDFRLPTFTFTPLLTALRGFGLESANSICFMNPRD